MDAFKALNLSKILGSRAVKSRRSMRTDQCLQVTKGGKNKKRRLGRRG